MKLTPTQAQVFRDRMALEFGAKVYDKERAVAMIAAAGVLGTMQAFGASTPKAADFLERFSTTIPDPEQVLSQPSHPGSAIYLSKAARATPEQLVITMAHECHHARRQRAGWPSSTWFYAVDDNSRAEEEVQAYVVGESVSRRVTGARLSLDGVLASLSSSYHLGEGARSGAARRRVGEPRHPPGAARRGGHLRAHRAR